MDPQEIVEMLQKISDSVESSGDKLRQLSTQTDDIDVKTLINSLSVDTYGLAQDIVDAIDTYRDILEEQMEEYSESIDDEIIDDDVEKEDLELNS